jgi:ribosome biogenesis protein NSA2
VYVIWLMVRDVTPFASFRRKKEAREAHRNSELSRSLQGMKAKQYHQKRFKEKIEMKKTIAAHEEKESKARVGADNQAALPHYLLDREGVSRAKVLSNTVKQKRKEKAGKWSVPIPKVKPVTDDEMFNIVQSGKRKNKSWKRMVTKVTFVGEGFTRKPPKYERFVRPMALRHKKAHVTHPELKTTFCLDIIGVKKNPSSTLYTQLGVITKGTIIEVNVSDLGLVTPAGKVVWGKYAQVTNNPELDNCINAVLLV